VMVMAGKGTDVLPQPCTSGLRAILVVTPISEACGHPSDSAKTRHRLMTRRVVITAERDRKDETGSGSRHWRRLAGSRPAWP
jgi:hypothetical protein